jgi:hypothetical protein
MLFGYVYTKDSILRFHGETDEPTRDGPDGSASLVAFVSSTLLVAFMMQRWKNLIITTEHRESEHCPGSSKAYQRQPCRGRVEEKANTIASNKLNTSSTRLWQSPFFYARHFTPEGTTVLHGPSFLCENFTPKETVVNTLRVRRKGQTHTMVT